ncbi:MAG: diacylglycerol kinase family lipid kinase [Oscillospiraceae bacterium]|nr:diacylglycerol kinase family lipid kinase [Oscillospiraceae bacterium]
MKKIYFIVNLQAGKAEMGANLAEVLNRMTRAGMEVTVHPTQAPLDATYMAAKASDSGEYDAIWCSGGDGTLNEVITGLMRAKNRIPLGYIPCGSVNDFARSIGIPCDIPKATDMILDGIPRRVDTGTINERCFNYIAAFGAFTDVTYETPQNVKNMIGPLAYIINAATKIRDLRTFRMNVCCDGQEFEDDYIYGMITNSASVGGMLDINDFHFDDGMFEITLIKQPNSALELRDTLHFLRDIHEIGEGEQVICLRASEITIQLRESANVPWTVDGEYMQNAAHVHIVNHKQAVSLLVPKSADLKCFTER